MFLGRVFPYFALTVIPSASILCEGHSDEAEAAERRPAVQGSPHLSRLGSGLNREPTASTRHGSLTFTYDQKGNFNSTKALHSAKLKRLAPSVLCDRNQMTLSVKLRGSQHFLIDSGNGPLTPLSQMPATCGFSVKKSRRDVQYAASYQGCHVNKKEDEYSLPLRLWGEPMTMSCPDMLPLPSIFCFPNKMVVKIRSVALKELKIKVSGTWQPLSSACSSCELSFNESSGVLTLIAPYNKDLCVEIKDEEYFLSLQWADFELSASCPKVPNTDLTTGKAASSSDSDEALPRLQYPQLPIFSQFQEPQSTHSPGLVAPLPFSFVAADFSENQKMPGNLSHDSLSNLFFFPRSESQTHPFEDEKAQINQLQLPQAPLFPQYQIPFFQEFPMMPEVFFPTTAIPLPAKSTDTVVTTPTPTKDKKPQLSMQPESAVIPQYPFPPFPEYPQSAQHQAVDDGEFKSQRLPAQGFNIPMLYSSSNLFSQLQNAQSPTATNEVPPSEKALYQPHPYILVYVIPKHAAIPVFLHPPSMTAPSNQHGYQPFYLSVQPFNPFLPAQSQTTQTNTDHSSAD